MSSICFWASFWSVHPLVGNAWTYRPWSFDGQRGEKVGPLSFPVVCVGFTPYIWISFGANQFFPSWGWRASLLELVQHEKSIWIDIMGRDGTLRSAMEAWGWIPGHCFYWQHFFSSWNFFSNGEPEINPCFPRWIFGHWLISGIAGVLFLFAGRRVSGPRRIDFHLWIGRFLFLKLLERGIEKKHSNLFSGTRLAGGASRLHTLYVWIGFLFRAKSYFRNQFYFP